MSAELQGKLRTVKVNFAGAIMASCLMRRVSETDLRKAAGRLIVGEDGFHCVGHVAQVLMRRAISTKSASVVRRRLKIALQWS